tara:strand:- start:116 stop:1231 length:1116 start_codon:yes stop_codon:yes gene_type:complete
MARRKIEATVSQGKIISLLLLVVVGLFAYQSFVAKPTTLASDSSAMAVTPAGITGCPDTLSTTIYARLKNDLNTTEYYTSGALEIYDKASGAYLTQLVTEQGTSGNYVNTGSVTWCGKTLQIFPTINGSVSSLIKDVSVSGAIAKVIQIDGSNAGIEVDVSSGDVRLNIVGEAFSDNNEVRMYDDTNRGYVYNSSSSTATDWISCAGDRCAKFGTTSANTSEAVGAGGQLAMTIEVRSAENYENAQGFGYWVFVDAGTSASTYWNDFAITVNGNGIAESSSAMTSYEAKRYSGQDWAFLVEGQSLQRSPVTKIGVVMDATSNNPPAQNITFTIAPRGTFKGQDGKVQVGSAKDDTSYSAVVSDFIIAREIS